jgi:zeaxanthin glucosyltransferase
MGPVVFIIDTISHAYSSIGVARRLQRVGYLVEYWGSATNVSKQLLEAQGFTYRDIDGLWSRYHDDIRLPTGYGALGLLMRPRVVIDTFLARRRRMRKVPDALERCESALDTLLRTITPAFIVIDPFLLAYYPFLWARQVKTVVLCTKPLAIADPLVPPYDSYLMPPTTRVERVLVNACWKQRRLADVLYRAVGRLCEGMGAYTYSSLLRSAAVRAQFPLRQEIVRRWIRPDLRFRSVYEWVLWVPEMDLPRQYAPAAASKVNYIGPSVYRARKERSAIDLQPVGTNYLIYVAVGTARFRWQDNITFLRKVIDAFRNVEEVTVIISTSDARGTAALGAPPPNVAIYDFAPQMAMLQRADLVITHAGAGTLRECIENEVPLLAYPRNHDQMGNAVRIAFHHIGLRGRRTEDAPADIREKAMRILRDPSFRQNLRRLREAVHASEDGRLDDALANVMGLQHSRSIPLVQTAAS